LPAASLARTAALCGPSASVAVVHGLVQSVHDPESRRHWKVEPPSDEVKANVGVASVVIPLGPEPIVVFGAVVSVGAEFAPTVTALTVVAVSPSASVTVTRTFLTPGSWKVNDMVLPVPRGDWPPAGPSVPSSSHV
jgi:hypothetical protein